MYPSAKAEWPSLMPIDTLDYMAPAWAACMSWAPRPRGAQSQ